MNLNGLKDIMTKMQGGNRTNARRAPSEHEGQRAGGTEHEEIAFNLHVQFQLLESPASTF